MEEYNKNVSSMEVDSTRSCKSLLLISNGNKSDTNDWNDSFPYTLGNEPQKVVEKHEVKIPEQQNTVSSDFEDDSELGIYDQMGTIKKSLSAATKNTNLFIRETKKDPLYQETFFIQKNNPSSNPLVKSNQIKIPSTSVVNMPKTTTSKHLQPKSSTNTEIGHNESFFKPNHHFSMFRINDFSNVSRIKKYIPHTVSSKYVMEGNSNTIVQNGKVQINTICPQKLNASSSQLLSNSEYLKQLDSSALSYGRVLLVDRNGWYKLRFEIDFFFINFILFVSIQLK